MALSNPLASERRRPGCVGVPLPNTRVRIVRQDPDEADEGGTAEQTTPASDSSNVIERPSEESGAFPRPARLPAPLIPLTHFGLTVAVQ